MILLAFLLPVAIYLLVLGAINRRAFPVVVSGTWDAIGLLLAASGFLLFAGPGILSSLNERWRLFWLLGQRNSSAGTEGAWQFWVFLSVLYFVVVAVGSAFLLWSRRHLTAVYNVDPPLVERALAVVLERLGGNVVRSGNLYFFNPPPLRVEDADSLTPPAAVGAGQSPPQQAAAGLLPEEDAAPAPAGRPVLLEVESSERLRSVTLRWDPAESPIRHEVETGLRRVLEDTPVPPSELGGWMTTLGLLLLGLCVVGCGVLVIIRLAIRGA